MEETWETNPVFHGDPALHRYHESCAKEMGRWGGVMSREPKRCRSRASLLSCSWKGAVEDFRLCCFLGFVVVAEDDCGVFWGAEVTSQAPL